MEVTGITRGLPHSQLCWGLEDPSFSPCFFSAGRSCWTGGTSCW